MRRNMLNNKFYKYGEKVYMLVATSVYLEYNRVERYLTVEADLGFIFCIPVKVQPLVTGKEHKYNLYIDLQSAGVLPVEADNDYLLRDAKEGDYISSFRRCYVDESLPIHLLNSYSRDVRFTLFIDYLDAVFSSRFRGTINAFVMCDDFLNEFNDTVSIGRKVNLKGKDGNLTVMNTLGTLLSFEELAGWYSICDVRTIIYED